jgi:V/A-type H+-transporting ATPase subunit G/H
MVDETLKRLLDAEAKAEQIVALADEERQSIIEQAKRDAGAAEQQHAERMAEIHASFLAQAEQRAQQTITALQHRHAEQVQALRSSAQRNEQQALAEAVVLLTGKGTP